MISKKKKKSLKQLTQQTYAPQFFLFCLFLFVQLRQSQLELQEVQVSHRRLSARLEELTEEHSLQSLTPHPSSLLCEIEQSMEQEEQEQEREQVAPLGLLSEAR